MSPLIRKYKSDAEPKPLGGFARKLKSEVSLTPGGAHSLVSDQPKFILPRSQKSLRDMAKAKPVVIKNSLDDSLKHKARKLLAGGVSPAACQVGSAVVTVAPKGETFEFNRMLWDFAAADTKLIGKYQAWLSRDYMLEISKRDQFNTFFLFLNHVPIEFREVLNLQQVGSPGKPWLAWRGCSDLSGWFIVVDVINQRTYVRKPSIQNQTNSHVGKILGQAFDQEIGKERKTPRGLEVETKSEIFPPMNPNFWDELTAEELVEISSVWTDYSRPSVSAKTAFTPFYLPPKSFVYDIASGSINYLPLNSGFVLVPAHETDTKIDYLQLLFVQTDSSALLPFDKISSHREGLEIWRGRGDFSGWLLAHDSLGCGYIHRPNIAYARGSTADILSRLLDQTFGMAETTEDLAIYALAFLTQVVSTRVQRAKMISASAKARDTLLLTSAEQAEIDKSLPNRANGSQELAPIKRGDRFVYCEAATRQLGHCVSRAKDPRSVRVYQREAEGDFLIVEYATTEWSGVLPLRIFRDRELYDLATEWALVPPGADGFWTLANQSEVLALVGVGGLPNVLGFPEHWQAREIDSSGYRRDVVFSTDADLGSFQGIEKRFRASEDGFELCLMPHNSGQSVLQLRQRAKVTGKPSWIYFGDLYPLNLKTSVSGEVTFSGIGNLLGVEAVLQDDQVIIPSLPKELVPNEIKDDEVAAINNPNAVLVTIREDSPAFARCDLDPTSELGQKIANATGIVGFEISTPNNHLQNYPPHSIQVVTRAGRKLTVPFDFNYLIPGNVHSGLSIRGFLRIGKYSFHLEMARRMSGLGVYEYGEHLSVSFSEMSDEDYRETHQEADLEPTLEKELADSLKANLQGFASDWGSEADAHWQDASQGHWVSLQPANACKLNGVDIAVRLGGVGLPKLTLTEGQVVFLRLKYPPGKVREYKYSARGGKLIPGVDRAPPDPLNFSVRQGRLTVHLTKGLIADGLRRAFPKIKEPRSGMVFDPGTKRLFGFDIEAQGQASELTEFLSGWAQPLPNYSVSQSGDRWVMNWHLPSNASDRMATLREGFQAMSLAVAAWLQQSNGLGRPEIDDTPPSQVKAQPVVDTAKDSERNAERRLLRKQEEASRAAQQQAQAARDAIAREAAARKPARRDAAKEAKAAARILREARAAEEARIAAKLATAKVMRVALKEALATEEGLPALSIAGELSEPTSMAYTLEGVVVQADLFDIIQRDETGYTALVLFGNEEWKIHVATQTDPLTYTRQDPAWQAERKRLLTQKEAEHNRLLAQQEKQRKQAERKWSQVEIALGKVRLELKNGLDEAVLGTQERPVALTANVIAGRVFVDVIRDNIAQLQHLGIHLGGTHIEVLSLVPIRFVGLNSLSTDLIPHRAGSRVPFLQLDHLYGMAAPAPDLGEVGLSGQADMFRDILNAAPIFLPNADSLNQLPEYLATRRGEFRSVFRNQRGDKIVLSLVYTRAGWQWVKQEARFSSAGTTDYKVLDGQVVKVGGDFSFRRNDAEMRPLWDLRIKDIMGVPCVYGAHQIESVPDVIESILDRLALLASLIKTTEDQHQGWVSVEPAEVLETTEKGLIQERLHLRDRTNRDLFLTYSRDETAAHMGAGDVLVGEIQEPGKESLPVALRFFTHESTQSTYAVQGEKLNNPEAAYLVQWIVGRGLTLTLLSLAEWLQLAAQGRNRDFFNYLQRQEFVLASAKAPVREWKVRSVRPVAVWENVNATLSDDEKFSFQFGNQDTRRKPTQKPGVELVKALKGEVFRMAPQNIDDVIFGNPPLGTKQKIHLIGNRGDVLSLDLTYCQSEDRETEKWTGWMLHSSAQASNQEISVEVNGMRLGQVQYVREGGKSQVITFGAEGVQVELRYFSVQETFIGFREVSEIRNQKLKEDETPDARKERISAELGKHYDQVRSQYERLLRVSGVLASPFVVQSSRETKTQTTWQLAQGLGADTVRISLIYQVQRDEAGNVAASLPKENTLDLTVNRRVIPFDASDLPGQKPLFLRQRLDTVKSGAEPLRFRLGLKADGSPRLRRVTPGELDITEFYLDKDVRPDGFVPVIQLSRLRGPVAILGTAAVEEWEERFRPTENPDQYATTAGLLTVAGLYFRRRRKWAYQAARKILGAEAMVSLGWSADNLAVQHQDREFFEPVITLADGRKFKREDVLLPADLESDPFFVGFGSHRTYRFLREVSGSNDWVLPTSAGNPVLLKEDLDASRKVLAEKLSDWQARQSSLHGHDELSGNHKGKDGSKGRSKEETTSNPDSSSLADAVMTRDLKAVAIAQLSPQHREIVARCLAGEELWEIAEDMGIDVDDIKEIFLDITEKLKKIVAKVG